MNYLRSFSFSRGKRLQPGTPCFQFGHNFKQHDLFVLSFCLEGQDRGALAGTAALIIGLIAATVAIIVVVFIVFIVRLRRTRGRYMKRLQRSGRGGGF